MKLFKKALVATAVVGAFGAQAVTVSSDKLAISQQGIAEGNAAITAATDTSAFILDFVVDKLTPAASTITLTFSKGVDLSNITVASSSVNNVVGSGVGVVDTSGSNDSVEFNYGTGSFTFDKFSVDTAEDQHVIAFDVNLGNPLTASSAFRLTFADIDDTNGINIGSETDAEVCYKSVDANDVLIEEGCSTISELKDQFAFEVTQEWNGKIERVDQVEFSRFYDGSDVNSDTVKFKFGNDESLLAAIPAIDADVVIAGNFEGVTANMIIDANFGTTPVALAPAVNGDEDEISFQIANADFGTEGANAGTAVSGYIQFTADGSIQIPVTGDTVATVDFNDGTFSEERTANTGDWSLDATVINVPYLPLLFTDTSSSVHVANDGNVAANVMATIVTFGDIDGANQTRSESVDLGTVPANTVVKYKQGALADAFGITDATKVSITFNIDAYAEDISAYATIQNSGGRTEVSNSQAKVDGKGL